jgi:uncharacterized protein (DUF1810 family)
MADMRPTSNTSDLYDLHRFVQAQANAYERALLEVRQGRKRSHWMWYIFPQCDGLGSARHPSAMRSRASQKLRLI